MKVSFNQSILDIQKNFDINAIYAQHLFYLADKKNIFEDIKKLLEERPKPFVKWAKYEFKF